MSEKKIVFLPVPDMEFTGFPIDPDIPIPVEITAETGNPEPEISVEMIVSGMLCVIKKRDVKQEWLDYYSNLVLFLRPDILEKVKKIEDNGLNHKSFLDAYNLIREGKAEEGLDCIRIFLEKWPLVWNGWFLLGWALRLLTRWKDAEIALKKAVELGGGNSDIHNELAICLMEQGNLPAANRELEAALKDDPENVKIISNLGVLAHKTGDKEKAAAFFRTVLEIDPNDPVAKNFSR